MVKQVWEANLITLQIFNNSLDVYSCAAGVRESSRPVLLTSLSDVVSLGLNSMVMLLRPQPATAIVRLHQTLHSTADTIHNYIFKM